MYAPDWRLLTRPAFGAEEEAPSGTSVAEAREALHFWRGRLRRLPWYRRGARSEARTMIVRWRRRLWHAQLERWRVVAVAGPVLALAEWLGPTRVVTVRRATGRVLRVSAVARMVALAAAAVTVAAVAVLALAVVVLINLV